MNLLRNPWVTAALAVIAVLVVWKQLFPSRPVFTRPSDPPISANASVAASRDNGASLNLPAKQTTPPEPAIDRDYIEAHLSAWVALPDRDPFQLFMARAVEQPPQQTEATPWVRWKLKAIWIQQGSKQCVINSGIYTEGDMIDGYRIDKIEDGHVWLQGPKLRERLTIDKLEPDADTTVPVNNDAIIQQPTNKPPVTQP